MSALQKPEAPGLVAARWMALGEWRAHPGRVLVAVCAIAVGVALGFAIHLINASALSEFGRAINAVNGEADLHVRAATAQGLPDSALTQMATTPGVAGASAVVELEAELGQTRFTLLGLDPLRAAQVTPALVAADPQSGFRSGQDPVYLSEALMAASGRRPGESVELSARGRRHVFRIAGLLEGAAEGQMLAVIDIAQAQWRFDRLGRIDRVDLRLEKGAAAERVRGAIQRRLPPDAQVTDAASDQRGAQNLSRAYRVNLNMLALMALLTGGFLVYSAQSLSVARRRGQFALLRVLGLGRRALLGQILAEGAVLGLAGGLLGLALGAGLARTALALFGGDLGGGYFEGATPRLVVSPVAAGVFLLLGLAAATAGSFGPARQAARSSPAQALKNTGDAIDPRKRPRGLPALAALAAGAGAAFLPPAGGLPLFGYVSMALLLAGGVAAMPWLARLLLTPLQKLSPGEVPLDLAVRRLWGAPSQAAVALCGIVASTSLMIAMAVMVASFRTSVDDWLVQVLPADVYMRLDPSGPGLDPEGQAALAGVPGVARLGFVRTLEMRLAPDRAPVALVARPLDETDTPLPLHGRRQSASPGQIGVWASEPYMRIYGRRTGDLIRIPVGPGGEVEVVILGVWRDYARQGGAIVMRSADFQALTGDKSQSEAAIWLDGTRSPQAVIATVRSRLAPGLGSDARFARAGELRALALRIFDRSFAVTYVLEAVAILVGLTGVAATISAQTLARTKEFGMLRHVGVLRRQIMQMLLAEGALLGALGGICGLGLGLVMSQVLIHVINPQSFNWTMDTRLPLGLFAGVLASLVLASALAALAAGRRALSGEAVRAVREDW